MKVLSKLMVAALAITLTFNTFSGVAFAEETPTTVADDNTMDAVYGTRGAVGSCWVYTDRPTTVYYGNGTERWLHITTKIAFGLPIKLWMEDYNGKTQWTDSINGSGTTHWYVGANIRYVYLQGGPCALNVTDTAN